MPATQLEVKTLFQDPHGSSASRTVRTAYTDASSGVVTELIVGPPSFRMVRYIDELGLAAHRNETVPPANTLIFHRPVSSDADLRANEVFIDHTEDPCLEDLGLPTTCAQDATFLDATEMQDSLKAVRERLAVFLA
ncbi:MAG: hypothetical protein AAB520_03050 [Patescibacteria group bacterium]